MKKRDASWEAVSSPIRAFWSFSSHDITGTLDKVRHHRVVNTTWFKCHIVPHSATERWKIPCHQMSDGSCNQVIERVLRDSSVSAESRCDRLDLGVKILCSIEMSIISQLVKLSNLSNYPILFVKCLKMSHVFSREQYVDTVRCSCSAGAGPCPPRNCQGFCRFQSWRSRRSRPTIWKGAETRSVLVI